MIGTTRIRSKLISVVDLTAASDVDPVVTALLVGAMDDGDAMDSELVVVEVALEKADEVELVIWEVEDPVVPVVVVVVVVVGGLFVAVEVLVLAAGMVVALVLELVVDVALVLVVDVVVGVVVEIVLVDIVVGLGVVVVLVLVVDVVEGLMVEVRSEEQTYELQ